MEASSPFAPDFSGDKVKPPDTWPQSKMSSRGCQPWEIDGLCGSQSRRLARDRVLVELELLGCGGEVLGPVHQPG